MPPLAKRQRLDDLVGPAQQQPPAAVRLGTRRDSSRASSPSSGGSSSSPGEEDLNQQPERKRNTGRGSPRGQAPEDRLKDDAWPPRDAGPRVWAPRRNGTAQQRRRDRGHGSRGRGRAAAPAARSRGRRSRRADSPRIPAEATATAGEAATAVTAATVGPCRWLDRRPSAAVVRRRMVLYHAQRHEPPTTSYRLSPRFSRRMRRWRRSRRRPTCHGRPLKRSSARPRLQRRRGPKLCTGPWSRTRRTGVGGNSDCSACRRCRLRRRCSGLSCRTAVFRGTGPRVRRRTARRSCRIGCALPWEAGWAAGSQASGGGSGASILCLA